VAGVVALPLKAGGAVLAGADRGTQVANSALTHDGQFTDNELSSHS